MSIPKNSRGFSRASGTVSKTAEAYLLSRPDLVSLASEGLLNYSALARKILLEEGLSKDSFDAVLASLRRTSLPEKVLNLYSDTSASLLKSAKISSKTNVSVAVIEKETPNVLVWKWQELQGTIMFNSDKCMFILDDILERDLKRHFHEYLSELKSGLALITLSWNSSKELLGHIMGLLSINGVLPKELLSSRDELHIITDKKDLSRALKALQV